MKNVRNCFCLLVLLVVTGCNSVPSDPTVPTYDRICNEMGEDWYGCYTLDSKNGYYTASLTIEDINGKECFVMRSRSVNKMVVFDQKIDSGHSQESYFSTKAPFNFVGGFSKSYQDKNVQSYKVTEAKEGGYNAEVVQGGVTTTRKVPAVDLTAYDMIAPIRYIRYMSPKVGEKIKTKDFDFTEMKLKHEFYDVKKISKVMVNGEEKKVYEMTYNSDRRGKLGTCEINAEGVLTSIKLGAMMEFRKERKADAMNFSYSKDVFRAALLKLNRPLCMDPKRVSQILLEAKGTGAKELADGPNQRVIKKDGKIFFEIKSAGWKKYPATAKEIKDNLESTIQYPCHDKRVIKLAKKAAGNATTVREKAKNILHFVDHYLRDTMDGNAVTVFQIIKQKKGDCSEHAMLYTALARAVGIPAREAHGYVYCSDRMMAFGGHAWNEVVIDGNWEPLDPSWGEMPINATHIRCGTGEKNSMKDMGGCLDFNLVELNRKTPPKVPKRFLKKHHKQAIPNVPSEEEKKQVVPNVPAK